MLERSPSSRPQRSWQACARSMAPDEAEGVTPVHTYRDQRADMSGKVGLRGKARTYTQKSWQLLLASLVLFPSQWGVFQHQKKWHNEN